MTSSLENPNMNPSLWSMRTMSMSVTKLLRESSWRAPGHRIPLQAPGLSFRAPLTCSHRFSPVLTCVDLSAACSRAIERRLFATMLQRQYRPLPGVATGVTPSMRASRSRLTERRVPGPFDGLSGGCGSTEERRVAGLPRWDPGHEGQFWDHPEIKEKAMADHAGLDGHHKATVEKIFSHPVSHNIQWHDVLSLLRGVSGP